MADLLWYLVRARNGEPLLEEQQTDKEEGCYPSWSWASKMAVYMGSKRSSLRHKEREERDPFDTRTLLTRVGDLAICFTDKTGEEVPLDVYMRWQGGESYRSFRPWFDLTCWSVWGRVREGIPLDRFQAFREADLDDKWYEELDVDCSCKWARRQGSVLVVFLGMWVQGNGEEEEQEEDGTGEVAQSYGGKFEEDVGMVSDVYCLLCEQVGVGVFRRIGLWSVGESGNNRDSTKAVLDSLLKKRVILSEEHWERRRIRLV